jgi:hypothetical protein
MAISLVSSARAAFWVSPTGDDRSPGTEEQPFRTIEHARDVVRTLNHDMADDITVFIAGEYRIDRPIALGPQDSGTNGFNVVYTAAPGENPAIDGARRVTGWTIADRARNLWSAPSPQGLSSFHDLFVNGTPASRTRSRLLAVFSAANPDGSPAAPDPGARWKNLSDVVFEPAEPGSIWSERTGAAPVFVANAFELLGSPGDWYFDRPAGRIYYTPRPGEDIATADTEVAVAPALLAGTGTADHPMTGLVFKGIRFEYTSTREATGAAVPEGAVHFAHASGIQFLEDDFLHMGAQALSLGPAVDGSAIEGCLFGDTSWSAIGVVASSAVKVTESRFSFAASDHIQEGAIDVTDSADVAVDHDEFDHVPTVAVRVRGGKDGAVIAALNRVEAPLIRMHGAQPASAAGDADGAGISRDYRALEGEKFNSPTSPRPPTEVSAEAEDGFAYVTWIPSCRDGGAPVASYTVESSTGAKTTVSASEFLRKGYVVVNDLGDRRPVSFSVSASNALGAGPLSPQTANVTPRQKKRLRPPAAPASVSVTVGSAGSEIRIAPPSSDGGGPIISYLVTGGTVAEPTVIEGLDVIRSDAAHPVSRAIPGLVPAHGSTVSVVAVNSAGEGKPAVLRVK